MRFFSSCSGVGIDVSEHHIRLAQMNVFGRVKHTYEFSLPEGLVHDEAVVDLKSLKTFFHKEIQRSVFVKGKRPATLLLPDSRIFSSSFFLPYKCKGQTLIQEAREQAQKEIPLPFENATITLSQTHKEERGFHTAVYAVQKSILDDFRSIFEEYFFLRASETNSKALLRLLMVFLPKKQRPSGQKDLIGIVDIGHTWSTISFYTPYGLTLFSRSTPHELKEIKQEIILPKKSADLLIDMVRESVLYFEQNGYRIPLIVLGGTQTLYKNIQQTLAKELPQCSSAFIASLVHVPGFQGKQLDAFGACIGAAMRSVHPRYYAHEHNFIH